MHPKDLFPAAKIFPRKLCFLFLTTRTAQKTFLVIMTHTKKNINELLIKLKEKHKLQDAFVEFFIYICLYLK